MLGRGRGSGAEDQPRQSLRIGVVCVSATPAHAGTHNVILGLRRFLEDIDGVDGANLWGIRSLKDGSEVEITCLFDLKFSGM